jgi:hypothetical protein
MVRGPDCPRRRLAKKTKRITAKIRCGNVFILECRRGSNPAAFSYVSLHREA